MNVLQCLHKHLSIVAYIRVYAYKLTCRGPTYYIVCICSTDSSVRSSTIIAFINQATGLLSIFIFTKCNVVCCCNKDYHYIFCVNLYYKRVDAYLWTELAPVLEGYWSRRRHPRKGTSVDRVCRSSDFYSSSKTHSWWEHVR